MRFPPAVFACLLPAAVLLAAPGTPLERQQPPRQEPVVYAVGQAPSRLTAGIAEADAAIAALQRRLSGRLLTQLQAGDLNQAIAVCRSEAPALTAQTVREEGIRVGRTSHRLRNPRNAAPRWAESLVAAGASRRAAAVQPSVVDLGDRVGVLRPIATASLCLRCHGRVEILPPDVKAFLSSEYPDDRATGFEEGDLRGFAWAEAPLASAGPSPGR